MAATVTPGIAHAARKTGFDDGSRGTMGFPQSEPVAQLVEHRTFNAVVAGSSPARLTINLKGFQFTALGCLPPVSSPVSSVAPVVSFALR
jgi:hypothetical protein